MNAARTTVSIHALSGIRGQKFGIAAQLCSTTPTLQRTRPNAFRSLAADNESIVATIVSQARESSRYGRALVDWEQFRNQCGPFAMMSLAHSLCRGNGALFVEFVVGENLGKSLISHDARLFIDETFSEVALRIDQAFFGDAAQLISMHAPSLVSLEFSDTSIPLRSTEVIDIIEACNSCGAWVSLASAASSDDVAWLIDRGLSIFERIEPNVSATVSLPLNRSWMARRVSAHA